jgi:hypothetical protein
MLIVFGVTEAAEQVRHLEEDGCQRCKPQQPARRESQARPPRPRRVQHEYRRNDRKRRECDHERQRNEFSQHDQN